MWRGGGQMEDSTTLIVMETKQENSYGSITMSAPVQPPDRNVFSDRATRVDYVLVWEEPQSSQNEQSVGVNPAHRKWREEFLGKLKLCGLLLEQKIVHQTKIRICFVLLSAPWSVLCYYAEEISLRVPLQVVNSPNLSWSEQVLSWLSLPNPLSQDVPNPPLCYYTCQFRPNKLQRFLGSDHKETFFKTTQRHQVLYEILARTPYGCVNRGQVGIDRLLSEQVFTAAYPLHEGAFQPPAPPLPAQAYSLRQVLYWHWARWSCWRRYQPLDHVREYFGEKVALYFAWLGFYTAWLLPASLLGTLVFMVGVCLMVTDVPAKEVCDSGDGFIMCPTCNICTFWNYSSICVTYKAGILFDNGGTVFLSVFMSLWAVTFLEYWKRSCSSLSHRWNCSDFEENEERPRPEFTAMAPMTMRNPVTGAEEPYFPENKRFSRTLSGFMVIIIMIVLVLMCLIAIILCRSILSILIYKSSNSFFSLSAGRIASLTSSVLNLLVILMLSRVYTALAHMLTRWEMHRTQSKYEDMFILKVFIFQFVNFYSSPVYIAFFKGRFVGYPGNYNTLFGIRNEDCGAGGCLVELAQELLVIMVGKQLINNIQEFIIPKLKSWWQKRRTSPAQREVKEDGGEEAQGEQHQQGELAPWEADYQLLVCEGLLSEYLEMVIQFGFITIFVAACPLAPFFALINNWVEIRLDAQKFVTEYRRPVVEQAQDIGIWLPIMQFITHTAVLSNAFLIAFTSSFLPRLYYRYTRDNTLSGFVNFTLATSHNYTQQGKSTSCRSVLRFCYVSGCLLSTLTACVPAAVLPVLGSSLGYQGFRDDQGQYLPHFFHLLAIQLAFVIIFEHVVFFIGRLIDMMVPDVPEEVEMKIKREHYMAKRALAENRTVTDTMFPGEQDPLSRSLRQRGSRLSQPTQNESPPPNLKKILEETDSRGSC